MHARILLYVVVVEVRGDKKTYDAYLGEGVLDSDLLLLRPTGGEAEYTSLF